MRPARGPIGRRGALRETHRRLSLVVERLTERYAGDPEAGSALPLDRMSASELMDLEDPLTRLQVSATGDADEGRNPATELLADAAIRFALLRLATAVLRLPVDELGKGSQRVCRSRLTAACLSVSTISTLLLRTLSDAGQSERNHAHGSAKCSRASSLPTMEFASKLLQTQALHAASRQLAAVAQPSGAVTAGAAAGAMAQQAHSEWLDVHEDAVEYADVVIKFIFALCSMVCVTTTSQLDSARAAESRALLSQLAEALTASCAMEHAARALLWLLATPVPARMVEKQAVINTLSLWITTVAALQDALADCMCADGPLASPATAAQLRSVLSGSCLRHANMAIGLVTLCAADGGSTHNMSRELFGAVSAAGLHSSGGDGAAASATAAGRGAAQQVLASASGLQLQVMMKLVPQWTEDAWTPGSRSGTLSMCLRAGQLAVASTRQARSLPAMPAIGGATSAIDGAAVGSSGSAGGPAGSAGGGVRLALDPYSAPAVLFDALRSSWFLLKTPSRSPRWAAGVAEWWRLAMAAGRLPPGLTLHAQSLRALGTSLRWASATDLGLRQGVPLLPEEPPVVLAAALDAGLVTFSERLLRRAGEAPSGREVVILVGMYGNGTSYWDVWATLAPLLAFGAPRQAAALVATIGKLLRGIDPWVLTGAQGAVDTGPKTLLHVACSMLTAAAAAAVTADRQAAVGVAASPATRQLLSMLSLALSLWLPPLSRLAHDAAQLLLPPAVPWRRSALAAVFDALVGCLPLVAACCGTGGSAAAAAAAAAASDVEQLQAHVQDGGWRALLLEDTDAVGLLGTALQLAAQPAAGSGVAAEDVMSFLKQTAVSCCAVAAVCSLDGSELAAELLVDGVTAAAGGLVGSDIKDEVQKQEAGATVASRVGAAPAAAVVALQIGDRSRPVAAAAPPPHQQLPWRPELLRSVASQLRALGAPHFARKAEALASRLDGDAAAASEAADVPQEAEELEQPLAQVLPPPTEARRLLPRTCANPGCVNLEGDSELELTLRGCSGCGAVGYCCRACQTAHWRAGHKQACARRAS